jgi:UDP-N-acetylglucosamine 2-epimerase (non-hydrolysing)
MNKKVMLVFGTRPEAIKMAPLYHSLKADGDGINVRLCVTAQHRQMLDQVLDTFEIRPDIDLNLMRTGQDLNDVTSAVLLGMRGILASEQPDVVLVHGDTTTAMATALACFYAGVPVGHVEAGLRTYNLNAPFPEEFNRQMVGKMAKWHFAPTEKSRANLLAENIAPDNILVTGNTVIDALHWVLERIEQDTEMRAELVALLGAQLAFDWHTEPFVLITGHRRENFGDGFHQICAALKELAVRFPDIHFVYPVHLNPNVRSPVNALLGGQGNVHLIEPLAYEPFVLLLKHCFLVLTDSGGIQEEAPSLGKPVLVMREVTERPEAVEAGTVALVGADYEKIVSSVATLIEDKAAYEQMARAHNPYGDGQACPRIVQFMKETA